MLSVFKTLICAALLATGNPQHENPCQQVDAIMQQVTNNACSFYTTHQEDCVEKIAEGLMRKLEKDPSFATILEPIQAACKEECTEKNPEKIIEYLKEQRKKINCRRANLKEYESHFCQESQKQIQEIQKNNR